MARRIAEREQAKAELQNAHDRLEQRVKERTAELEQRNREATLLTEMGSLFQACATADEAYRIVAHFARQMFPGPAGALFVRSPSRTDLEALVTWGDWPATPGAQVFAAADCWALRRGRLHVAIHPATGIVCRHETSPAAGHLCVPMAAQGEALGVLYLQLPSSADGNNPSPAPALERLALAMAEHVGLALSNLQLRETLRSQSIRDPITGLFNRRYMEETLERELRRAARAQNSLSIIMMDLDHFKHFNDMFGHDAGDAVLRELGAFLMSQVRGSDIACRYGGEEFTLILPETSQDVACQRAETTRAGVKQLAVHHRGQSLGSLSLSLGVAVFPEHGLNGDVLLRHADQALYQAKLDGRDRDTVADAVDKD
ncbi:MAG TPA: diguanylate cyclase [Steroidobacteraceae bacterium]|nr:diguanylate cyclase [Steroidobacteraceae bacterium]